VDRSDLAVVLWMTAAAVAACRGDFQQAFEFSRAGSGGSPAGPFFEVVALAGQAHALSRLGRHAEAVAAADLELRVGVRSGIREYEAGTEYDRGVVALNAGAADDTVAHLRAALCIPQTRFFSRPLARLLLAQALLGTGELAAAERELDAVPAEPVAAADVPDTLVARMVWIEGLVAALRADWPVALDRLAEAEQTWRRRLGPEGIMYDGYAVNLVDLGRPPVAGLIEPAVELSRVLTDRAAALAACVDVVRADRAGAEAATLAATVGYHGYRSMLTGAVPAGEPSRG
jgi:hypothetical protein